MTTFKYVFVYKVLMSKEKIGIGEKVKVILKKSEKRKKRERRAIILAVLTVIVFILILWKSL